MVEFPLRGTGSDTQDSRSTATKFREAEPGRREELTRRKSGEPQRATEALLFVTLCFSV